MIGAWIDFYGEYRRALRVLAWAAGALLSAALLPRLAQAVAVSNVSFSHTTIAYETNGTPTGTSIYFTIDSPGRVSIQIDYVSSAGSAGTTMDTITRDYPAAGNQTYWWDGLWLISGEKGRYNGDYRFTLTLSTGSGSASTVADDLVEIDSLDIHSLQVNSTTDESGNASAPYTILYALAKEANVTATLTNSSGTIVRTLLNGRLQVGEMTASPQVLVWDGLDDGGSPVPIGIYTLTLDAAAPPPGADRAITRTRSIAVTSLAGAAQDAQKIFEENVYVYPNPIRDGRGTFRLQAVRNNSKLSLKIYTLTGDLVRTEDFPNRGSGEVVLFPWTTTNEAGRSVGRGLYFYVVREESAEGTLQVTKKVAVIR